MFYALRFIPHISRTRLHSDSAAYNVTIHPRLPVAKFRPLPFPDPAAILQLWSPVLKQHLLFSSLTAGSFWVSLFIVALFYPRHSRGISALVQKYIQLLLPGS